MFALIPIFAAVVLPPTVTKSFSPPVVGINQLSMVTITITNPNSGNLTGASMNDSFTSGLLTNGTAATTCPGGSAFASPTLLNLAAATIPATPARSVIYIFLSGGLAQHDSFDLKPDAPTESSGKLNISSPE